MTRLRNRLIVFVWQRERDSALSAFFVPSGRAEVAGGDVSDDGGYGHAERRRRVLRRERARVEWVRAAGQCGRRRGAFRMSASGRMVETGAGGEGISMTCDKPQRWRHYIARRVWIRGSGHPQCCARDAVTSCYGAADGARLGQIVGALVGEGKSMRAWQSHGLSVPMWWQSSNPAAGAGR